MPKTFPPFDVDAEVKGDCDAANAPKGDIWEFEKVENPPDVPPDIGAIAAGLCPKALVCPNTGFIEDAWMPAVSFESAESLKPTALKVEN